MNIFRKLFKKKKPKKFMECETLEEFIEKYKKFHKLMDIFMVSVLTTQ